MSCISLSSHISISINIIIIIFIIMWLCLLIMPLIKTTMNRDL